MLSTCFSIQRTTVHTKFGKKSTSQVSQEEVNSQVLDWFPQAHTTVLRKLQEQGLSWFSQTLKKAPTTVLRKLQDQALSWLHHRHERKRSLVSCTSCQVTSSQEPFSIMSRTSAAPLDAAGSSHFTPLSNHHPPSASPPVSRPTSTAADLTLQGRVNSPPPQPGRPADHLSLWPWYRHVITGHLHCCRWYQVHDNKPLTQGRWQAGCQPAAQISWCTNHRQRWGQGQG